MCIYVGLPLITYNYGCTIECDLRVTYFMCTEYQLMQLSRRKEGRRDQLLDQ